jgi:hypothetical protein
VATNFKNILGNLVCSKETKGAAFSLQKMGQLPFGDFIMPANIINANVSQN